MENTDGERNDGCQKTQCMPSQNQAIWGKPKQSLQTTIVIGLSPLSPTPHFITVSKDENIVVATNRFVGRKLCFPALLFTLVSLLNSLINHATWHANDFADSQEKHPIAMSNILLRPLESTCTRTHIYCTLHYACLWYGVCRAPHQAFLIGWTKRYGPINGHILHSRIVPVCFQWLIEGDGNRKWSKSNQEKNLYNFSTHAQDRACSSI